MNSFIKTIFWAIMTILVIAIASLIVGVIASSILRPSYYVTTTEPNTFTFTKISKDDMRVKDGNYFNLTQQDIGNYTGLTATLNDLANSSVNTQYNFGGNITAFNIIKSFFLTKSHGLSVFAYKNSFIEFTINGP